MPLLRYAPAPRSQLPSTAAVSPTARVVARPFQWRPEPGRCPMKHMIWAIGLGFALGATPAVAQTRVSVAVGFGVPRPFVRGVVVVGRPFAYYPPAVVVVRRPYFYRH